jgi:hypothetical protein
VRYRQSRPPMLCPMRWTDWLGNVSSILWSRTWALSIGEEVAGTRVMRTWTPWCSRTEAIPRQCDTWRGAIAGPIVTESKPRRPWQNTTGWDGAR